MSDTQTESRPGTANPLRLKKTLVLREEGEEGAMLYDYDAENLLLLNGMGAVLLRFAMDVWGNALYPARLVDALAQKYGESKRETFGQDVQAFLDQLKNAGMLEDAEGVSGG
jgi:hypothetical protein